jgi:alkylation response protein AidB-like acyl-CoA dehydrogenase
MTEVLRNAASFISTEGTGLETLVTRLARLAPETDSEGDFPEQAFAELAEAGLLAVTLPGGPLDFRTPQTRRLLTLLKRIGAGNLAVGRVYEGHLNALWLIHLYATPAQRDRWYADVTDRHCLFSVWNTQADDGVRLHADDDGTYRLEGAKTFCSGAGWVRRPLITGELYRDGVPQGWQMGIISVGDGQPIPQDSRFWQPLGMRASASFRLDLTGVTLRADELLGTPGQYYQPPHFVGGAIRFAAVQLGGAEAIFEATRQFLRELGRTDDPFQRARMAEMALLLESGQHWLGAAGDKTDAWLAAGTDPATIGAYANAVRTAIEEICLRVMPLAERCVGARGLLRPQPFERLHRDLTHYLRQPAPDAALTDLGRYVLHASHPAHALWR